MRILVFWDSISEWFWDYKNGWWVNMLKTDYWKKYWYDKMVFNFWVSAYTSKDILNYFDSSFKMVNNRKIWKEKESDIIFSIWINDSSKDINTSISQVNTTDFKKNIETLVEKCQKNSLINNVIFVGNINVDESIINKEWEDWDYYFYNDEIQKYNTILENIAKETTCSYIDVFWLMNNNDLEDGLHPNTKWHNKIYSKVKEFLNISL